MLINKKMYKIRKKRHFFYLIYEVKGQLVFLRCVFVRVEG